MTSIDRLLVGTFFIWLVSGHCLAAQAADPVLPSAVERKVDFARDVQPIFAAHCFKCHGATKQESGLRLDQRAVALRGGDSGEPAVIVGKSADSLLVQAVAGVNKDLAMPPEGEKLSAEQIGVLRAWIDQGVAWPDSADVADAKTTHWSFQPVAKRELPAVTNTAWPRGAIDRFVLARLEREKLAVSNEADRATLVRRVKFDLLGLPPTPAEVADFVRDENPDAYERFVDRLLASPQLGERWARHWLDVVRFAESDGFETNQPRPNAWPYRDYVIRAFNEDKPYDRFVFEQLAGDTVGEDSATGFVVGGPYDRVKSPDIGLTLQQRADEMHDMVSTTGSAFLGLTVGCARCHNHKFDPVSQRDYYAMKACFAGVQHGERPLRPADDAARQRRTKELEPQLAAIERQLSQFEPLAARDGQTPLRLRAAVTRRANVDRFAPVAARFVRMTIAATNNGSEPCLDEFEIFSSSDEPRNVALASAGARATASGTLAGFDIHKLEHVHDGRYGNSRSWISNTAGRGWLQIELPEPTMIERVVWSRDREEPGKFEDRVVTKYTIEVAAEPDQWQVVATSADRAAASAKADSLPPTAGLTAAEAARLESLFARRQAIQRELASQSAAPMAYSGRLTSPEETFRLHRGDPLQKREPVPPAALASFSGPWQLPATSPEQERRVALARWITDPRHPLTARVIVNRLWHYHFGQGLVATPSDLGLNGARPSHPELVDWLAGELLGIADFGLRNRGGSTVTATNDFFNPQSAIRNPQSTSWSLKTIHRHIVTSAAYRQASGIDAAGMTADAGSRLLWRFPPRRLEAEVLRDTILAASGQLDLRMGGPGFDLFDPNTNYVKVYNSKQDFGPAEFRRMVYQNKPRMQLDDTFGPFDCPDAGQVAPKRGSSNTPLQALNLLNSRFILQQSGFFAARLQREAGPDPAAQIQLAFQIAFGRNAAPDEVTAASQIIADHGLPILCRTLLNANEFLYVF